MGIRDYRQLILWQLARELRREVFRLLRTPAAARDLNLRDQLVRANRKIGPNLVEGFRRFHPADFARFVRYSYAGCGETAEWLADGEQRGYWTGAELSHARRLLALLDKGLSRLLQHLDRRKGRGRDRRTS